MEEAKKVPVTEENPIKTFCTQLRLLQTPSPLWGVHIDSNKNFLAFSTIHVLESNITNKVVVLSKHEGNSLKVNLFMNNKAVTLPSVQTTTTNIVELNDLIHRFEAVKFCRYLAGNKECLTFVCNSQDKCDNCIQSSTPVTIKCRTNNSVLKDIRTNCETYKCFLCCKIFADKQQLLTHENIHVKKTTNGKFECKMCTLEFDSFISFTKHNSKLHSCVKYMQCTACDKQFSKVAALKNHIRNHTGYEIYWCMKCNKDFFNKHLRQTHLCKENTKPQLKLHTCSRCNKSFKTSAVLLYHQRHQHKYVVGATCKFCKKQITKVEEHTCTAKALKYLCNLCSKKFPCASQKINHMRMKHYVNA